MADLFTYQSTQQIASATVPTITVTPNLSSSRAFESLGKLVSNAQQLQLQDVNQKQQVVSQQIQIQNIHNQQQASMAAAKKAADKVQAKIVSDQEIAAANLFLTDAEDNYNVALAQAGDDLEKKSLLTGQFRKTTQDFLATLNPVALKSVQAGALGTSSSAIKSQAGAVAANVKTVSELANKQEAALTIGSLDTAFKAAMGKAGTNVTEQQSITTSFVNDLAEFQATLDPVTQASTFDQVQTLMSDATQNHVEVFQKYNVEELQTNVTTMLPTFFASNPKNQTELYNSYMKRASELNMDKREFGQFIVKSVKDYALSTMNVEAMTQNYDYSEVDKATAMLKNISALDSKSTGDVNAALQEIEEQVKQPLDAALMSSLKLSLQVQNKEMFDALSKIAVDNKAASPVDMALYGIDYKQKSNDDEAIATKTYTDGGGRVQVNQVVNNKQGKLIGAKIKADLTSQFTSGEIDFDDVKWQSAYNPEIYKEVFNSHLNTTINGVIDTAAQVPKEPEAVALRNEQLVKQLQSLDNLMDVSHGAASASMRLQVSVAKTLASSGSIVNIPMALNSLRSQGEVTLLPTTSNLVEDLKDDVPPDQFVEARRVLSALVTTGQTEDQDAYDAVVNTFSYESIEGLDVSGSVMESLTKGGMAPDSMEQLQNVLFDPDFVPTEVSEPIQAVLAGTNPKVSMINGNYYFTNDEKSSAILALNRENMAAFTSEINKRYQDANFPVGIERISYDAGASLADATNSAWESIKPIILATTALPEAAAKAISSRVVAKVQAVADFPSHVNKHIESMYAGASWADTRIAIAKEAKETILATETKQDTVDQDMKDQFNSRIDAVMGKSTLESMATDIESVMNAIVSFVIPKAEGSALTPQQIKDGGTFMTPLESVPETKFLNSIKKSESSADAVDGTTHQGAEATKGKKATTTTYGVRTDYHGDPREGETDRQHALRVFRDKFQKPIMAMNIKNVDKMLIAELAWNTGASHAAIKDLNGLDFSHPEDLKKGFLFLNGSRVVTSGGKWMRGLIDRRAREWNEVAKTSNPDKIIKRFKLYKESGVTKREYVYADGSIRVLQTDTPQHSKSTTQFNAYYNVK